MHVSTHYNLEVVYPLVVGEEGGREKGSEAKEKIPNC